MDGQTRYAELGYGIAIGAQSACARSGEFARVIHIKTPGEASRCAAAPARSLPWQAGTIKGVRHLWLDHHNKTDFTIEMIERLAAFAAGQVTGDNRRLLIHCGAGMHRSPTVAAIALMARGLTLADAMHQINKACMYQYDQEPIVPWWHHSTIEAIRVWEASGK